MAIGFSKEKQLQIPKKKLPLGEAGHPVGGQSPLTPKKRKPLKFMSKKQAQKIRSWRKVVANRIERMIDEFGCVLCEYCLKQVDESEVQGHHNDHDRNNNTPENCRLTHEFCNTAIEDNNVKDVPSLL